MVLIGDVATVVDTRLRGNPEDGQALIRLHGSSAMGNWRLVAASDSATTFILYRESDGYVYRDSELVTAELLLVGSEASFSAFQAGGWFYSAVVEWLIVIGIFTTGLLLIGRLGEVPGRLGIAFIVGISALATTGVFLPRGAWSLLGVLLAAAAVAVTRRWMTPKQHGYRAVSFFREAGVFALAAFPLVFAVRWLGLIRFTPDSFDFLSAARMLGTSSFNVGQFDHSFYIGQQAIHAVGFALGSGPVYSAGWVVLFASVWTLTQIAKTTWFGEGFPNPASRLATVLVLVAGSPYVWRFAAYVNSHMIVAGILLAIWLLMTDRREFESTRLVSLLALFSGYVFMRGEAPLILMLVVASVVWRDRSLPRRTAGRLWALVAIPTGAWSFLLFWTSEQTGQGLPRTAIAGVMIVALCFIAWIAPSNKTRPSLAASISILPWLALAAAWFALPTQVGPALMITWSNAVGSGSNSGLLALISLMLVAVIVASTQRRKIFPNGSLLRWIVLGYFPIVFLARMLSEIGWSRDAVSVEAVGVIARYGWSDSTSRMMFHLWFLLIAGFLVSDPINIWRDRTVERFFRPMAFVLASTFITMFWVLGTGSNLPYRVSGAIVGTLVTVIVLQRGFGSAPASTDPAVPGTLEPARRNGGHEALANVTDERCEP